MEINGNDLIRLRSKCRVKGCRSFIRAQVVYTDKRGRYHMEYLCAVHAARLGDKLTKKGIHYEIRGTDE